MSPALTEAAPALVRPAPALVSLVAPDPLPLQDLHRKNDRGRWLMRVTDPFEIRLRLWDGQEIALARIEAGFETDGVSRPAILRALFKAWGPEEVPAILHDWLLELRARGLIGRRKFLIDVLFLVALAATGISFARSVLMFAGVSTRP